MKLKTLAKKSLKYNPAAYGLYAAGGAINELTGGKTKTYRLDKALKGKGSQNKFSLTTRAASGYSSATPKAGDYGLPVVNRATTRGVGKLAATVVHDVAAPVANEASKGLFGVSLPTLLWTAGGLAVGLGGVAIATR